MELKPIEEAQTEAEKFFEREDVQALFICSYNIVDIFRGHRRRTNGHNTLEKHSRTTRGL